MPDREKVIKGIEAIREFFGFGLPSQSPVFEAYQNTLTDALVLLKEQEAVVRCRECKWYERCELNDLMLNHENGFCADGERR